jgi:hypothetical protein
MALACISNEQVADKVTVAQVSSFGGETGIVPTALAFPQIEDISPRGSELLIKPEGADVDAALWILPVPSGAPRRLGNISAAIASWLPDGGSFRRRGDRTTVPLPSDVPAAKIL